MSSQADVADARDLSIEDVDSLVVTHVGGWQYQVLNTGGEQPTAYEVDIKAMTCTCPDHEYRRDGTSEVCKHVAKALLVAPATLSMDQHAATTVLEVLQEDAAPPQTDATDEEVAEAVEAAEADESDDSGAAADASDADDASPDNQADAEAQVRDWLKTGYAAPELVDVVADSHGGQPGVRLEPDSRGMDDAQQETFKTLVKTIDEANCHAGFLDSGCDVCGDADDGYWWFVPMGAVPE
jgi:hypothetical protein